jgi:hypothetical protein
MEAEIARDDADYEELERAHTQRQMQKEPRG